MSIHIPVVLRCEECGVEVNTDAKFLCGSLFPTYPPGWCTSDCCNDCHAVRAAARALLAPPTTPADADADADDTDYADYDTCEYCGLPEHPGTACPPSPSLLPSPPPPPPPPARQPGALTRALIAPVLAALYSRQRR